MKQIWVIGKPIVIDGLELGWMLEGIFWDESTAACLAKEDEFIALCRIGERLPEKALDAEKLYYPKHETWETSTLFKMREKA